MYCILHTFLSTVMTYKDVARLDVHVNQWAR